ncbi:MAG: allophanate hydrolase [Flavobacteriales bacterium]|jgi:allophanate hydrolase
MSKINLEITALRNAYLCGERSVKETILALREQALAQSEFNAWITVLSEAQLCVYIDALDDKNPNDFPLWGIPFAIKDNIDLAGVPTTAACKEYAYVPKEHARVVELLIEAGAIPLGKANMDQFATGLVGVRSPYGEGRNVFNPDYISGGSSAGSAIATALGQVSFALGTDTAGSGRVPAALNNLIGHKPSRGLLSTRGVVPACRTLDCVSILSLTAADAACVLDVASEYDSADAYSRKNTFANTQRFYTGVGNSTFRFGVPQDLDFQGDAETQAMYQETLKLLTGLGGEAIPLDFSPFIDAAKLLYDGPWVAERWLATQGHDLATMLPVLQNIIGNGNNGRAADVFDAQYRLKALKVQCDEIIRNLDFVLTPTIPTVYRRDAVAAEPVALNSILGTYTNFMNLLDYSATAVPVGRLSCGVSWGVTVFSTAFKDVELLNYSAAIQNALGLTLGATDFKASEYVSSGLSAPTAALEVAVCGAHLDGQPLNWQLRERGAVLLKSCKSAKNYKLFALADGKRPAMIRDEKNGEAIALEVWSMPAENYGSFVTGIPAPLGIGKVELDDNSWVSGFICDVYGLIDATDISTYGGWLTWLKQKNA